LGLTPSGETYVFFSLPLFYQVSWQDRGFFFSQNLINVTLSDYWGYYVCLTFKISLLLPANLICVLLALGIFILAFSNHSNALDSYIINEFHKTTVDYEGNVDNWLPHIS
jgi:hypothetical protein